MSGTPNDIITRLEAEKAQLQAALDQSYAQLSEVTSRVLAMSEAATSLVETHDPTSAAVAVLDVASRAVLARTPDFLELAGSIQVPAAKRNVAWDEVLRRARADRAEARH